MIIGNGMIGKAIANIDCENICFFTSGVSSSSSKDQKEFDREKILLTDTLNKYSKTKIIVYFSSSGIEFENTPYFEHKINMEKLIESKASSFYIFRLSQVVGHGGNKNTLFNHLVNNIINKKNIEVWQNVTRNLIDVDDISVMIDILIKNKKLLNNTVNIVSPYNIEILEIIKNMEIILKVKADFTLVNKGEAIFVDPNKLSNIIDLTKIFDTKDLYLQKLITKYGKVVL